MRLFEPIKLRGAVIPNRLVKSAMAEGLADAQGRPTPGLVRLYDRWGRGGVGLAITGMAHLRPAHGFTDREIGLHDDACIEPLGEVVRAFQAHGGKIFAQLCHAPPQHPRAKTKRLGAVAPSAGLSATNLLVHRAIDASELERLIDEFGAAARRARAAGFDGVQLHAAHGYLLSRMLSPRFNRRSDRWGGDFERRLTFLHQVIGSVRAAVGDDFPVAVKLNVHDGLTRGLAVDQGVEIARRLERWGVDAIEVSAGVADVALGCYPNKGEIPVDLAKDFLGRELPFLRPALPLLGLWVRHVGRTLQAEEGYFVDLARRVAEAVRVPVMAVGGIRSRDFAERVLSDTAIAMISLARPLVRQPFLPRDWRQGRSPVAQCTSCNRCFVQLGLDQPLRCWNKGATNGGG